MSTGEHKKKDLPFRKDFFASENVIRYIENYLNFRWVILFMELSIKQEENMNNTFRLSLKIDCWVNEEVPGDGDSNKKSLRCTRGIVNRLLKHPGLLNEFYATRIIEFFLKETEKKDISGHFNTIEKEDEFWEKIKSILPAGLLSYYEKEVLGPTKEMNSDGEYIKDANWNLIFNQLNNMKLIQVSVEELKKPVNKDVVEAVNLLVIDLDSGDNTA